MEVSLQPSRARSNHLAHQQFAFSPDFSFMPYTLSGFQFLETFFPDILYSSAMPCTELSLAVKSLQICFLLLFLSAEFPDPLKISPADSISLMRLTLLLWSNLLAGFVHFGLVLLMQALSSNLYSTKGRRLTITTNDTNYFRNTK